MPSGKEIRNKIKSVENTRKITKAMEMVAASKMRKAQDRMRAARPFAEKIRRLAANLSQANVTDYKHPFLVRKDQVKRVGLILVTTDKGLCGGLNTNVQRIALNAMKDWESSGVTEIRACAIGNKGLGFMQRMGAKVVSNVTQLGDTPHLEKLIGPVKVMLDAFQNDELDAVFVAYTRFVNTMKQEPVLEQLLPLTGEQLGTPESSWDYLYEPDPQVVIDELLVRYVESLIYQAVAENMASEQSARTVAMKAASDNAKRVIDEFGGKIYDGAAEIISELSAVTQVFIVSNCDDWYLEAFFRHSELQRYMAGYDCFGMSRVSKSLMLKNMTGVNNLVNPVYIGDTHSDFEAAQEANADFIFAEYGFGVLDQECMRIKKPTDLRKVLF